MTKVPELAMSNFKRMFVVETDAYQYSLGTILMQDRHLIAYYSKILGIRARKKSIYEKELMAIVFAILKWKHYILGRRFQVKTNQQSLKHLLEQIEIHGDYQKWVMKLMGFDFSIDYNPGKNNLVVDALLRIMFKWN